MVDSIGKMGNEGNRSRDYQRRKQDAIRAAALAVGFTLLRWSVGSFAHELAFPSGA